MVFSEPPFLGFVLGASPMRLHESLICDRIALHILSVGCTTAQELPCFGGSLSYISPDLKAGQKPIKEQLLTQSLTFGYFCEWTKVSS